MAEMGKPLRLKDLLELDCDSCSAAGFRCYPRRLGESSSSPMSFSFCRSPSSLRRPSKLSNISRSLSRRLRGSFRWRRNDEEVDAAVRGFEPDASPSESSDESSGRTRSDSSGRTTSRSGSDSEFTSTSSSSASESMHAAGDEHEDGRKKREVGSSSGSEADDKEEQLSPVAVMDFPCFDDDAGLCSPSLDDSLLSRVQAGGIKTHKVRRFGSLDELVPVDLEARLAASSDANEHDGGVPLQQLQRHAEGEDTTPPSPTCSWNGGASVVHEEPADVNGLLALLMDTVLAKTDAVSKRLLLDFFVEVKVEQRSQQHTLPRKAERLGDGGAILAAARGWLLDGTGAELWSLEDVLRGGEIVLVEMERGRRWMQVAEEEREIGVVVAGLMTDQLVDELVRDFLV